MKKVLVIISIFIVFVLIYLLSANFFNWFTIADVRPNLFIIFVLFIGLFMGTVYGVTFGAAMGILIDLIISPVIRNKWNKFSNCGALRGSSYKNVF